MSNLSNAKNGSDLVNFYKIVHINKFKNINLPLIHVMFGVIKPHPNLDGISLSYKMENILHYKMFSSVDPKYFLPQGAGRGDQV